MTLGDKILHRWGWKPGKSIGRRKKKVIRPDENTVAEVFFEDPILQNPPIKNNHYGLGYVRDELDINREENRRREKDKDQRGGRIYTENSSASMGLGALEEVTEFDDVYRQADKSEYNTSIAANISDDDDNFAIPKVPSKRKRKKSRWGDRQESWVEGFVVAKKRRKFDDLKRFPGPTVPPRFVPEHTFESDTITLKKSLQDAGDLRANDRRGWHKMSDEMRKELLAEMKLWVPEEDNEPKKFIGDRKKKQLKDRLAGKFEVGDQLTYDNTTGGLQMNNTRKKLTTEDHIERARDKFSDNVAKQGRFDVFLNTKLGKKVLHAPTIVHQTELQRQLEEEEFEKVYQELAKKCKLDVNVLSKRDDGEEKVSINYGMGTRTTTMWQPERMLCRRFNVPYPKFTDLEEGMLQVQSKQQEDISIRDILKPPDLPKENRKTSRWGPKPLPGGPHQLKLEKLTEETTTAEKSDRINLILSSSAQDTMAVEREEQNTDLFDAVFNVPDSDDSDFEEQLARANSPSPEPERPPQKRVMTVAAPPPANALVLTKPPVPSFNASAATRIPKPVGIVQESAQSDNPLDALLSRVSNDGSDSSFSSILTSSTTKPQDLPKVSVADIR